MNVYGILEQVLKDGQTYCYELGDFYIQELNLLTRVANRNNIKVVLEVNEYNEVCVCIGVSKDT